MILIACLLTSAAAKPEEDNTTGVGQAIQAIFGLFFFFLAVFIFIRQRKEKEYVEFESFEAPTPTDFTNEAKDIKSTTFTTNTTTNMKEVSFEEGNSEPTAGEKRKRKRKAHRLSDRRRNLEDQVSEEVEQNSQL